MEGQQSPYTPVSSIVKMQFSSPVFLGLEEPVGTLHGNLRDKGGGDGVCARARMWRARGREGEHESAITLCKFLHALAERICIKALCFGKIC